MAVKLAEHMSVLSMKVTYLHPDIGALERIEILCKLRSKEINVLVCVSLLREGFDVPECGLVAILDADKEGFLRSDTSLLQTIGRAARNVKGKVILYADKVTYSMDRTLKEIIKPISNTLQEKVVVENFSQDDLNSLKKQMSNHAENVEFEEAEKIKGIIERFNNRPVA